MSMFIKEQETALFIKEMKLFLLKRKKNLRYIKNLQKQEKLNLFIQMNLVFLVICQLITAVQTKFLLANWISRILLHVPGELLV